MMLTTVLAMHNFMIPAHLRSSLFTRYPPRKVPPPPAGTVMAPKKSIKIWLPKKKTHENKNLPIKIAAKLALMLNSFSINFGMNAANPEIKNPSLAPAKFKKLKVGLTIKSLKARGISRSLRKASNWLSP